MDNFDVMQKYGIEAFPRDTTDAMAYVPYQNKSPAIVLYITPENEEYVPTVKVTDKAGNDVAFTCEKQENGKYKVVIRGIAAHMLANSYTVDIDNGSLTYTNLSALSYAYSTLSSGKSDAYKKAVSTLYDYYIATDAYLN